MRLYLKAQSLGSTWDETLKPEIDSRAPDPRPHQPLSRCDSTGEEPFLLGSTRAVTHPQSSLLYFSGEVILSAWMQQELKPQACQAQVLERDGGGSRFESLIHSDIGEPTEPPRRSKKSVNSLNPWEPIKYTLTNSWKCYKPLTLL